jgi:anti-sigma regulatory factor (Ser/Thr protein kinase)
MFKLTLTSDPCLLSILRYVVKWHALDTGFAEEDADSLAAAMDEAASNVIRHTYKGRRNEKITVDIRAFEDRLELAIEDSGPKVDVNIIRPRPLEDVRPGGLGTYFIQCFVDQAYFDQEFGPGNRLKLIKYIRREDAPHNESATEKSR